MNVSSDNRAAAFVMKGLSIWVLVGWVLFLYGFFILPKQNALKIEFYLLLVLPSLLLIPHWIKHYKKYSSPLLTMSLIFTGYMATTFFWSGVPLADWAFFFYKQVVFICLWLLVTTWVSQHYPKLYFQAPVVLVVIGSLVGVISVAFYFYNHGLSFPRLRGLGILENSLVFAQAMGGVALVTYVFWLQEENRTKTILYAVGFLCCGLGVLLTQSRGPIAAMVLTVLIVSVLIGMNKKRLVLVLSLGVISAIFVVGVFPDLLEGLVREGRFFSSRDLIWRKVLENSADHLWFGQGVVRFTDFDVTDRLSLQHSHNVFIDTIRFGGIVGVILLVVHLFVSFNGWTSNRQHYPIYAWLLFGCLCMLTNGKFLLVRPDWIWLCYWLPIGFICAAQNRAEMGIDR
jgi:hypothetical protein